MTFKTLRNFDFKGKTVLLRADLNVPVQDGIVSDTTRIDRLKPTIDFLKNRHAKIVVMSHFGRPKGQPEAEFSLKFMIPTIQESWGTEVMFANDCIGDVAKDAIGKLKEGDILLLENLRFHKEEEGNEKTFVQKLASLGDIYVNDAFSAAHRAHASTEGLAHVMPSCAGLLMETELNALNAALENPKKPVIAVVGGAKISTKLSVLNNLVQKVDYLILGGGMANTFLYAQNISVGKSLCEKDMAAEALRIMDTAKKSGCQIILPIDRIAVKEFGKNVPFDVVASDKISDDQESVDIGPESIQFFDTLFSKAKTVLWNGPMGVFEVKPFDTGTNEVAKSVAKYTITGQLISVAGGGDTVSALENAGVANDFTYISSAGGAFLEWLEGKTLPGVAALMTKSKAA